MRAFNTSPPLSTCHSTAPSYLSAGHRAPTPPRLPESKGGVVLHVSRRPAAPWLGRSSTLRLLPTNPRGARCRLARDGTLARSVLNTCVAGQVHHGLAVPLKGHARQDLSEQIGRIGVGRHVANAHSPSATKLAHLKHLPIDMTGMLRRREAMAEERGRRPPCCRLLHRSHRRARSPRRQGAPI